MTTVHDYNPMEYEPTPKAEVVDPTLMAALSIAQTSYPETAPKRELSPAEVIGAFAGIVEQMRLHESTDKEGHVIDEWKLSSKLHEVYGTEDVSAAENKNDFGLTV